MSKRAKTGSQKVEEGQEALRLQQEACQLALLKTCLQTLSFARHAPCLQTLSFARHADLSPNALIRKARSVKLKKKTVKAYMTANLWMKDSFDLER